jgi:hypothetical protein
MKAVVFYRSPGVEVNDLLGPAIECSDEDFIMRATLTEVCSSKRRKINLDDIKGHRPSLEEAPVAGQIFNQGDDHCVGVVMLP